MEKYYIILGLILMFIGVFYGLHYIVKIAKKFFRQADEIEKMIRGNEPKEEVIKLLYDLKSKSFHRSTGDRLNELAKMAEVKYDIIILKK